MRKQQRYRSTTNLLALLLLLAACDSGSVRNVENDGDELAATLSTSIKNDEIDSSLEMSSRLLDPRGSSTAVSYTWELYHDIGRLADDVDLVFVGTITRTSVNAAKRGPKPNDPTQREVEYDGVIFNVEEVLRGELSGPQSQVTIVQPVRLIRPKVDTDEFQFDATDQLLHVEPVDRIAPGITIANAHGPNPPRYLVFAILSEYNEGPAFGFYGPPSVVEVDSDGYLVATTGTIFAFVEKERNPYAIDISLDVVRDWLNGSPPEIAEPIEIIYPEQDE